VNSSVKQQTPEALDLIPSEEKQRMAYDFIESLLPDDVASPDDIAAHHAAMEEYRRGETVASKDVEWRGVT
jgi:hypothetical protein